MAIATVTETAMADTLSFLGSVPKTEMMLNCLTIAVDVEPSLYTVKAVFILDNDGNRLLSKYYDPELYPTMKDQKNFERNIFNKTHKADNEIAFLEGMTIVYKSSIDLFFYVVGSAQENELMLMSVLNCLFESLSQILRKNVERRCLLDNMEGVFLVVDEIIDGGVILESDPQQVLQKVNYRGDHTPQLLPSGRSTLGYWRGESNSDSRTLDSGGTMWFSAVLSVEQWTSSSPLAGCWKGHGSLPNQSLHVFCISGEGLTTVCPEALYGGHSKNMGWMAPY
ncbi:hypothetical protein L3Q82_014628 [Scortum barcoo]|uniref:Uncharacterized protein n=1 Tax=Scortum barcoo TaxID=214431 RepID=A0ACB8VXZ0_9TELE|nr:hypothetical protein L3Q82_014628 [Scortum barcoo]